MRGGPAPSSRRHAPLPLCPPGRGDPGHQPLQRPLPPSPADGLSRPSRALLGRRGQPPTRGRPKAARAPPCPLPPPPTPWSPHPPPMLALRTAVSPARAPRPRCTPGALHGRALPPGARAGMHPPLPLPFRTSAAAAAAPAAAAIAAALGPSRRGRPGSRGPGGRAGKGLKGATARFLAIFPGERPRRRLRAEACGSCFRLRGAGAGNHAGARVQGWPPSGFGYKRSAGLRTVAVCPAWPAVLLPRVGAFQCWVCR